MRLRKLQKLVVGALQDIKARDIEVMDVTKLTAMFDFVIVATADSGRQGRALAAHLQDVVKQSGAKIYGVEGEQGGEWVLVDCGDTVVHIMQPAIREHYNLEELWQPKRAVKRSKKADAEGKARQEPARAAARTKATADKRKPARKPATAKRRAAPSEA